MSDTSLDTQLLFLQIGTRLELNYVKEGLIEINEKPKAKVLIRSFLISTTEADDVNWIGKPVKLVFKGLVNG